MGRIRTTPSKYSGFVTIGTLAQFDSNPRIPHLNALKRILCYLKGTTHFKLRLGSTNADINLIGWTDSDWASDVDTRHSIGGFTFEVTGGFVSWLSKKQPTVALSSMEAEYMAGAGCVSQLIWCRMLLTELGFPQRDASILNMDNQSAIALAHNTGSQGRAKHIDIQYHFIRDRIASNEIAVRHCPGEDNPADTFTKPLARDKFEKFRDMLGVSASRGSVGK